MTRLREYDRGLKTLNLTLQTPQETLQGTPTTLPTSEPGTPQISYTVASGDLPTFGLTPYTQYWLAYVVGGGKAVTAATISARMKLGGSSVATQGNSVGASTYYTYEALFLNVGVGNQLQMSLWSNQSDSNWDYNAYCIVPTRVVLKSTLPIYVPFNITALTLIPTLTKGNPYSWSPSGHGWIVGSEDITPAAAIWLTGTQNFKCLHPAGTYGIGCLDIGDYNNANSLVIHTSGTYRPAYDQNYFPTTIMMRELFM
jgi:hypothetical protein